MSKIIIENGTLVSDGYSRRGYIVINGERIAEIGEGDYRKEGREFDGQRIDAAGKLVIPGVIDDQVHFREPGLTHKGDIHSESIAAVAGGVTSFMDMPNTKPPTVNREQLERKLERAAQTSLANYSFYLGATNGNIDQIRNIDPREVCGVKLFMGSSTGNMLVDQPKSLAAIFAESPVLVATHCEHEPTIQKNMAEYSKRYAEAIDPAMHPLIRSAEACYRSSAQAVELADRYGADLHVLHLSTGRELALFDSKPLIDKKITNEVCVHHLWFSDRDYASKGNMIKWNPAIKTAADRDALRVGLTNGRVDMVATDHAPHTIAEKQLPYWESPSGGPLVQHSLVAMLELSRQGVLSIEQVVEKMCHAPAIRFGVADRGFLREGAYADLVVVDPTRGWMVGADNILYKCGWSPFEGETFGNSVEYTIINGKIVNHKGIVDNRHRGRQLEFNR